MTESSPRPPSTARRWLTAAAVGVAVAVVGAGAAAALSGGDEHSHEADAAAEPTTASPTTAPTSTAAAAAAHDHASSDEAMGDTGAVATPDAAGAIAHHGHPELAPYAERYAAASTDQQAAADQLLADVRETLAPYADVNAALAAGYVAPADPKGPNVHYRRPDLVRDGVALDPSLPEGLVYRTAPGQEPVLLGAFFIAPRGEAAPMPAGDLVVWHSHNPTRCPAFFATAEAPCTEAVRMLHVWTVDGLTLTSRTGRTAAVQVADPFGAPFVASIAPA
jgi:hypothetical protein